MQQFYNLWISYLSTELLLALIDIKACFIWSKINPKVYGAFSYWMGHLNFNFDSTAMVFGVKASANSWELTHRAIKTFMEVYFSQLSNDSTEMQEYLNMVSFSPHLPLDTMFTTAKPCSIDQGCLDEQGF